MDFNQRVGARVKRFRRAAGMSQDELATMLSTLGMPLHQQGIVKIESGRRPLRLEEAQAVAEILGVDISLLLYDSHEEERAEIEVEIEELRDDIDQLRSEIAEREKKIKNYETRIQRAQERLRQLDG